MASMEEETKAQAPEKGSKLLRKLSSNLKKSFNTPRANSFSLQRMRSSSLGLGSPKIDPAGQLVAPAQDEKPAKENVPQTPSATVTQAAPAKPAVPLGDAKVSNMPAEPQNQPAVKVPPPEAPKPAEPEVAEGTAPQPKDQSPDVAPSIDETEAHKAVTLEAPPKKQSEGASITSPEDPPKKQPEGASITPPTPSKETESTGATKSDASEEAPPAGEHVPQHAVPELKSEEASYEVHTDQAHVDVKSDKGAREVTPEATPAGKGEPGKGRGLWHKLAVGAVVVVAAALVGAVAHERARKEDEAKVPANDLVIEVKRGFW